MHVMYLPVVAYQNHAIHLKTPVFRSITKENAAKPPLPHPPNYATLKTQLALSHFALPKLPKYPSYAFTPPVISFKTNETSPSTHQR
jgi:hypothetical protein